MHRRTLLLLLVALALTLAAPAESALAASPSPKPAAAQKAPVKNQKLSDFARQRPRDERGRFLPLKGRPAATTGLPGSEAAKPASTGALTGSSTSASAPKVARQGGLMGWLTRNFTVRSQVREVQASTRNLIRQGDLSGAADGLSKSGVKAQGWRESWVMAGVRNDVTNGTLAQLQLRSAANDRLGTDDAQQAVTTLKSDGQLGWWARGRVARAEGQAFNNILDGVNQAGRQTNWDQAHANLEYASQLRGPSNVDVARATQRLFAQSMRAARRLARFGEPEETSQALLSARQAGEAGGGQFDQKLAEQLMEQSRRLAVPNLLLKASRLYRNGALRQATLALKQSMEYQKSEGVQLTRDQARRQGTLIALLGPHMRAHEAEQARQTEADDKKDAPGAGDDISPLAGSRPGGLDLRSRNLVLNQDPSRLRRIQSRPATRR